MRGPTLAFLAAGFFCLPWWSSASAQSVLVELVASESGGPVSGAFVTLLDEEGRVLRRALTNDDGRCLLTVPDPGPFRVKAEMIGRETQVSSPFVLRPDPSGRVSLSLPVNDVPLEEIRVEAGERCRLRPAEASAVARVWDEARKALAVQSWTEEEGLYRLDISTWERDLDGTGRRVEREIRRSSTGLTRTPFASLPPEDLVGTGFVRPTEEGGHQYYGPDATVILSDPFLDTHCMRLTRSPDHPGSIGVAFAPDGGNDLPDIQGTFWLDEGTARLDVLEYRYTWAPYPEARGIAGGRMEFESLPDGAWILDRWRIRVPVMGRHPDLVRAGDSGIRVAAVRETGGEVLGVSAPEGMAISMARRGSLGGVVWDSIRAAPLEGATVYLAGTVYAGDTDRRGRFRIEDLPPGVFMASFRHPRLDSLGIMGPGAEVEIVAGETADLRLAVPSAESILLATCRAEERKEGAAVLSGVVRDRTSGRPIPGATVRVEWQEVVRTEPRVQARDRFFEVRADAGGRYAACGIPLDEAVSVHASFLEVRGKVVEVGFPVEEHRVQDLDVELPPGLFSSGLEARSTVGNIGSQGVQGVLVDPRSRTPVRSAEVSLRNPSGSVLVTGVTDPRGFFRLEAPTPGSYLFSGRALGYADVKDQPVDVTRGKLTVLEVEMAAAALELVPLVVTAEARSFHLEREGFYEREATGFGIFMKPELLEKRRPRKVSDLFYGLPGTTVSAPTVFFRSGLRFLPSGVCWPMVYVDRHLMSGGGGEPAALDDIVSAPDVLAIEVYRSPAQVPSEFHGANAGCGVVVIWTRRGQGG